QFKGFMQFNEMDLLLQKLDDVVNAQKTNSKPVIHLETNSNLKGLEFLEVIYKMIINKQVMEINYQSFKAKRPGKIIFHPYLLKEYRNRWFVLGRKGKDQPILNLALDRIHSIGINSQLAYIEDKNFHPEEYYKNLVGVTHTGHRPVNVHLFVGSEHAPYVLTKPLHHTQQLVNESDEGVEIVIKVVPNLELEREILGFGEHMKVLAPESLKSKIQYKLKKAVDNYEDTERIS
ncbi:MAG: WYL domain-containing protein, partial [Bacteroidales bacterium]|nr:WYL domain-containing protein [Bacteroidales bacterium]